MEPGVYANRRDALRGCAGAFCGIACVVIAGGLAVVAVILLTASLFLSTP